MDVAELSIYVFLYIFTCSEFLVFQYIYEREIWSEDQ